MGGFIAYTFGMRRALAGLICALCAVTLCACGGEKKADKGISGAEVVSGIEHVIGLVDARKVYVGYTKQVLENGKVHINGNYPKYQTVDVKFNRDESSWYTEYSTSNYFYVVPESYWDDEKEKTVTPAPYWDMEYGRDVYMYNNGYKKLESDGHWGLKEGGDPENQNDYTVWVEPVWDNVTENAGLDYVNTDVIPLFNTVKSNIGKFTREKSKQPNTFAEFVGKGDMADVKISIQYLGNDHTARSNVVLKFISIEWSEPNADYGGTRIYHTYRFDTSASYYQFAPTNVKPS